MTIPPFSTYPETRDELLKFAREIDKSPVPEVLDKEASDFVRAAYALADRVKGTLEDEKYAEEKGVYDDDWRPIDSAPTEEGAEILGFEPPDKITTLYRNYCGSEPLTWFNGDVFFTPTHWQPLPTPPKATVTEPIA